MYLKSLNWWSWSRALCEKCGMPRQFSADGEELVLWADLPDRQEIDMLDLQTHTISPIVIARQSLKAPSLSPDGHWIAFVSQLDAQRWQAFIVPVSKDLARSSDWIPITAPSATYFYAFWSAHNDLIYTLSSHEQGGNLLFLDAQKLDDTTKHPIGEATPIYKFDETLVPGMDPVWNNIFVDSNRIVLELGGVSSNIWIKSSLLMVPRSSVREQLPRHAPGATDRRQSL